MVLVVIKNLTEQKKCFKASPNDKKLPICTYSAANAEVLLLHPTPQYGGMHSHEYS